MSSTPRRKNGRTPPRTGAGRDRGAAATRSRGASVVSAAARRGPSRTPFVAGVVVLVVLVVVIGGYLYQHSRSAPASGGVVAAQDVPVSTDGGTIVVGRTDAPVTLDVYEDALCPVCAQFEQRDGARVAAALDAGSIQVRYHLLNFLNSRSASGDYSTRAAAAALAVARDGSGSAFPEFHSALFLPTTQPKEQAATDLSNAQLADLAARQGASAAAQEQISSGSLVPEAAAAAQAGEQSLTASGNDVATPTILDGARKVDISNPGWLQSLTG
ncbi:hypothetical protein GCM10027047_17500 [Rhodococcus aerolatus]